MVRHSRPLALLLTTLWLGGVEGLEAQAVTARMPTWRPALQAEVSRGAWARRTGPLLPAESSSQTHSHTWTGLLIGSLVGAAATAVFLTAFCSGADTQCGADEVGRAVVIIAVPAAVAGALIGSVIRSRD
jgi:hypothetical protein